MTITLTLVEAARLLCILDASKEDKTISEDLKEAADKTVKQIEAYFKQLDL